MTRSSRALGIALGVLVLAAAAAAVVWFVRRGERVTVTLVPGKSLWEQARAIDTVLPGQGARLLALAADDGWRRAAEIDVPAPEPRPAGAATWLEGYLYPETYFFAPDADAEEVIGRTTRQFAKVFDGLRASYGAAFAALKDELGLGPAEVVALASLVEEETGRRDEAARIAGVFLNRLRKGMRLETDPTLMYRADRVGQAPSPSERRDATNPYNTYVIAGLPPGPICSPGRDALVAVLEAERHDYLFFVAKRDGTGASAFAATLEEHEANIDRYLRRRGNDPKP